MEILTSLLPIILLALILWLLGLSIAFFMILDHYKKLKKGVKNGNLIKILDDILAKQKNNAKVISDFEKLLQNFEKKSLKNIQKIGLIRFNPFDEIGGDQSFSLCLLDGLNDGFIVTCLHTRDRSRVYAKSIYDGKSKYDLSTEEQKALDEAKKIKK